MDKSIIFEALKLSISERILLVEDIWDSIAEFPEVIPLPESQREELDRRLEAYHRNPKSGFPWEIVKKRIGTST